MDAVTLLTSARAAGLTVRLDGDRLSIRGPRDASTLVEQLRGCKSEIIAALHAEAPRPCIWPDCTAVVTGPWLPSPTHPGFVLRRCAKGHEVWKRARK